MTKITLEGFRARKDRHRYKDWGEPKTHVRPLDKIPESNIYRYNDDYLMLHNGQILRNHRKVRGRKVEGNTRVE